MNIEILEQQIKIERDKLNQIIIDNDLDMSCTSVIEQSQVVDTILSKFIIEYNS